MRALEVTVDAGANLTFPACAAAGGQLACNATRAGSFGGGGGATTMFVLRGALDALAAAIDDFTLYPRCALDDVTVGARLFGQSVPPQPPLNLTVRARARIAEAFRGTVVTNSTRFGSMVALAGARVTLNLTTDADADGARLLDDDVWVAASASAPRCEYNYTALTDASGAFRLDVAHPTSAHHCLLYTSPSPRDGLLSRMPSSA